MRLIKGFLVVSTALFIIITLLSLLIPSVVKVSRTVLISGTNKEVYDAVADLKEWHNWHPALGVEGTVLTYCDEPIAYTSKCCNVTYNEKLPPVQNKSVDTTSNKPGGYDGKTIHLQITSADSSSIKFIIEAKGENTIQNEIHITPIKEQGQLQVDWHSITKLHWYPWEKFYAIFMDKLTGPGYEAALEGLKNEVEKESLHP